MREEDQLQIALTDWEGEGGSVGRQLPERARASPPEPDLDPRFRRGSLGPPPAAAPLGAAASSAALQAHLAHLLDAKRGAALPLDPDIATVPVEERVSPHEDIERQPDGVPHLVIGLTALFSVVIAAVLIRVFLSGPTFGNVVAAVLVVGAIPVLVFKLGAKAERDRDHEHPSR